MRRSCGLHRRGTEQIAQADQVVGDHVQTKHLLDAPAGVDRLGVTLMAGGVSSHIEGDPMPFQLQSSVLSAEPGVGGGTGFA
jgi:hypothetical protein